MLILLSIIAYLTHVICCQIHLIKSDMIKKVLTTIVDVDSGEILYQPRDFNKGVKPLPFNIHDGAFTGEDACKRVFDSFLRGVKQGRNLSLDITIREFEPVQELMIF